MRNYYYFFIIIKTNSNPTCVIAGSDKIVTTLKTKNHYYVGRSSLYFRKNTACFRLKEQAANAA